MAYCCLVGRWLREVKFDGWRIQLHKHGGSAAAFTKNGHDHSSRDPHSRAERSHSELSLHPR
jgi:ATP-dependent DNA ligase